MEKSRTAVIINYISLIILLAIFYIIREMGLNKWFLLVELIPLIVMRFSFNKAYHRSGLWKMIHRSQKTLDERELQILHSSIRMSYNIFVILVLLLILVFAIVDIRPIDVVLMVCLGYIAHTLPAAVITFYEEEI